MRAIPLLSLLLIAVAASPASAATVRYAVPSGNGGEPCAQSDPCNLPNAANGSGVQSGDTVVLGPGTYHPGASFVLMSEVDIGGVPGTPLPEIDTSGPQGFSVFDTFTHLHDMRIVQTGGTAGLAMSNGATADRMSVTATGGSDEACLIYGGALRDSVCSGTGGATGLRVAAVGDEHPTLVLRNDTLVGTGSGADGIKVTSLTSSVAVVHAGNVIALGSQDSAEATADNSAGDAASIDFSHSDVPTEKATGGAVIDAAPTAGNLTTAPLLADAAAGDFHELAGSKTIGAGDVTLLSSGELDLDGRPRSAPAGCAVVDMGAYQLPPSFSCPVVPPLPPAPGPPPAPAPAPTPTPATAPAISGLSFTHRSFAVSGGKPRRGVVRGSTLRFTLSRTATVTMTVVAPRTGHRRKGACVARTTRCTRLVSLGTIRVAGRSGANRVSFSGRLKGHALHAGSYLLRLVAVAGGKSSRTVSVNFTIRH